MKICIVSGIFPPDIGGPATYLSHICEKINNLGHRIYVITFGDEYIDFPFPVQKISRKIPSFIRILLAFIKIIKLRKEIDIIFTLGGPWDSGIPALLAKIVLRKPMVTKISGDIAWERARIKYLIEDNLEQFQARRYSFRIEFFRWLQSFAVKKANAIIVPCEFTKRIVIAWGVREEAIKLIPNTLDDNLFPTEIKDIIKSQLNLRNNLSIVTMGRLVSLKGVDKLIRLLPELSQDINLIIIGDGPERRRLKSISQTLGIEDKVIFTGKIERQEVFDYLKASDLFVLYSDGEFMPFAILEAMASGLPVVASKIGGIPELIEDGKNGILVELKDISGLKQAISDILQNRTLRLRLISNAYGKLAKYTSDRMVKDILDVFDDVLDGRVD